LRSAAPLRFPPPSPRPSLAGPRKRLCRERRRRSHCIGPLYSPALFLKEVERGQSSAVSHSVFRRGCREGCRSIFRERNSKPRPSVESTVYRNALTGRRTDTPG
jgi:hypothetical protein